MRTRSARIVGTRSRRALYAEGMLSAAGDSVVQFLPLYLVMLSASAAQVGLLSSATGLAGLLALLPGAWLARRVGWRKAIVLAGNGAMARTALLLMAVVPFVLQDTAAVFALIALGGMRSLAVSVSQPAWTSLFAEVVPARDRRAYVSLRQFSTAVVAMAAAPAVGWLIGSAGGAAGFQVAFVLAAVVGGGAVWSYSRIRVADAPDEASADEAGEASQAQGSTEVDASPWADRRFLRFIAAVACLQLFAMMAGPFFIVYLVRQLGASPAEVGALAVVDPAAAVAGQALAAFLAVRFASQRLLGGAILVSTAMPLLWLVVGAPWQAAVPNAVSGATWAVFHLATFNLLMEMGSRDTLPRYAAAFQATGMVAAFLGPLAGSAVVGAVGMPALFLVSSAGRLAAFVLFTGRLPRPARVPLPWRRRRGDAVA